MPDTVVLAVNPLRAAPFTREAAAAGVPAVVIPGGGVVEGGEPAARMQAEVAEIARATGTAILGPNCMGLIDLTTGCATYIDEIHPFIRRGGVAAIAQSGSVADAFMHAGTRIGWSRIVSCGSEVVLDLCDYLAYCLDDPSTEPWSSSSRASSGPSGSCPGDQARDGRRSRLSRSGAARRRRRRQSRTGTAGRRRSRHPGGPGAAGVIRM